jgi:hypothetical protein
VNYTGNTLRAFSPSSLRCRAALKFAIAFRIRWDASRLESTCGKSEPHRYLAVLIVDGVQSSVISGHDWRQQNNGAGGGTRTRTELSLQRILSRLIIAKSSLFYWLYFHQMRKCVKFLCKY